MSCKDGCHCLSKSSTRQCYVLGAARSWRPTSMCSCAVGQRCRCRPLEGATLAGISRLRLPRDVRPANSWRRRERAAHVRRSYFRSSCHQTVLHERRTVIGIIHVVTCACVPTCSPMWKQTSVKQILWLQRQQFYASGFTQNVNSA